jgi:hypothetical protein
MTRRALVLAAVLVLASWGALTATGDVVSVSVPTGSDIQVVCDSGVVVATVEASVALLGCREPTPTPTTAPEWWLAGGVDASDCAGAWQGVGAASYAASLVNLCAGANLVAAGWAAPPDWSASVGWQGGQSEYFTTGIYSADDWTVLVSTRHAAPASQQFGGAMTALGVEPGASLNNTGAYQWIANLGYGAFGGVVTNGTFGYAGKTAYRYGQPLAGSIPAGTGTTPVPWYWLTANWGGTPHGGGHVTEVRSMVMYSATLTSAQVAAVSSAMDGLE